MHSKARTRVNKNCTVILTVLHFPNPKLNESEFKLLLELYYKIFFDLLRAPFDFKFNIVLQKLKENKSTLPI